MKLIPITLICTTLILAWCVKSPTVNNIDTTQTGTVDTTTQQEPDVIAIWWDETTQGSDTMVNDGTTTSYQLDMSWWRDTISVDLVAWDKVVLAVKQVPVDAYIRVSQIVYPDGTMDGPFEDGHTFDITTSGPYQFIIAPNMMASNEVYTGKVDVDLTLFRKS